MQLPPCVSDGSASRCRRSTRPASASLLRLLPVLLWLFVGKTQATNAASPWPNPARVMAVAQMLDDEPRGSGARCSDRSAWSRAASHPQVDQLLQRSATTYTSAAPQVQFSQSTDVFSLDLRPSYAAQGMSLLQRTMRFERVSNTITVSDEFLFDRARAFETAVTSVGHIERIDATHVRFTHRRESLLATFTASSAFELDLETIDEEGLVFQRLAVRLKEPQSKGFVSVLYRLESKP